MSKRWNLCPRDTAGILRKSNLWEQTPGLVCQTKAIPLYTCKCINSRHLLYQWQQSSEQSVNLQNGYTDRDKTIIEVPTHHYPPSTRNTSFNWDSTLVVYESFVKIAISEVPLFDKCYFYPPTSLQENSPLLTTNKLKKNTKQKSMKDYISICKLLCTSANS